MKKNIIGERPEIKQTSFGLVALWFFTTVPELADRLSNNCSLLCDSGETYIEIGVRTTDSSGNCDAAHTGLDLGSSALNWATSAHLKPQPRYTLEIHWRLRGRQWCHGTTYYSHKGCVNPTNPATRSHPTLTR